MRQMVYGLQSFIYLHPKLCTWITLSFMMMTIIFLVNTGFGVNADEGLGGVGNHLSQQAQGMGKGVKMLAYLAGFVLVVIGIAMIATGKRQQQPMTIPAIMIVAGIMLVSVMFFIGVSSATFFGSDQATGQEELFN